MAARFPSGQEQLAQSSAPSSASANSQPVQRFQLANARAGQAYRATPQPVGVPQSGPNTAGLNTAALTITELHLPPETGLQWEPASQAVTGLPATAGEYLLDLQYSHDGVHWQAGQASLIINPDPKSLWKVLPTPTDAPYPKPDQASGLIRGDGFSIAAASRRGRSHEHVGSFRDDDFFIAHQAETGFSVLLVADGAGSAAYSREGAKLAVTAAGTVLQNALAQHIGIQIKTHLTNWHALLMAATEGNGQATAQPDPDSGAFAAAFATAFATLSAHCHTLFLQAASSAVDAIEAAAQTMGHAVRDYATTLLLAITCQHQDQRFIATFWIGDGAIAACGPRGKVRLMGRADSGEFAGQTRFLERASLTAERGFANRIRLGFFPDISALILLTDGVSDPRFDTEQALASAALWDQFIDELQGPLQQAAPEQALLDWLHFFTPGHHDDRTLAILWQDRASA